jgi:hypothetical protein
VTTAFLLLMHATGLAFAIFSIKQSGERPQVLLYAFILEYLLRLTTIATVSIPPFRMAMPFITRPPYANQQSYAVTRGEGPGAPAGSFGTYITVMAVLTFFAFALIHANEDQELSLDLRTFEHDLTWGIILGVFYWSEALATRTIVIDPKARPETNFGYNTREVTVLAFAVLTAGMVVAARQQMGLPATGWAVLAPLLVWRALYDFSAAIQIRKQTND